MNVQQEKVFNVLRSLNIEYQLVNHPATKGNNLCEKNKMISTKKRSYR